jgi:enamine deaminase RidA (YjgF/YER057c/UK114 family)
LSGTCEYSAFNEVWVRHFGSAGPAFSIIPCIEHGLAPHDGKIEINVMAVKSAGATQKRHIDAGVVTALKNQPQAVRAGDLLCISGLMAIDNAGLVAAAASDQRQPHFASAADAQAEKIIDSIEKICEAAGTSIENLVRVQHFHTDLAEFYPMYKAWERRLGGRALPFSAVEVPAPLPVPGATVLIEAWAFVP